MGAPPTASARCARGWPRGPRGFAIGRASAGGSGWSRILSRSRRPPPGGASRRRQGSPRRYAATRGRDRCGAACCGRSWVARRLLLATALAVAIAALVAWLLAGRLTAPLRRLAGAARQLGAGQLSTRVRVEGDDEVAEVGAAFNEMAADIEHSQGEQRAFLASVSHELKTPLTAVQG